MKLRLFVFITGLSLILAAVSARAQNDQNEPLGTIARKLRKEQAKKPAQPVKVYTNDNIPRAANMGPAPSETNAPSNATKQSKEKAKSSASKHGEAYFQGRMKELRARLALHERQLAVLQQKLSQGSLEYYGSPQKELMQQSSPEFYSNQRKIKQQIAAKQDQIAGDHEAIDNLTQELRRDGGDPGWIR